MADKEYIEREVAKQVLELYMTGVVNVTNVSENTKDLYLLAKDHAKGYLSVIPAADVVEVRRGEWILTTEHKTNLLKSHIRKEKLYCCPYCGRVYRQHMNFCGNCGAAMRGTNDNTKR